MTRSKSWFVAIALFAAVAGADDKTGPLAALTAGDRVKVKVVGNHGTLMSTIESVTSDELVLSAAGARQPLRVSLPQLERLEVARGQRSQWRKGALIGLAPGALFGALLGFSLACDPYATQCTDAGPPILAATAFFGAATASVGALIGLAFKTDRWVLVHEGKTKASLILAPTGGGMRVGLSVSF